MFSAPFRTRLLAALGIGLVAPFLVFWWLCEGSANISYFSESAPAEWIIYPTPPIVRGLPAIPLVAQFERSFVLDQLPSGKAPLEVRALKQCGIQINGKQVDLSSSTASANWKDISRGDVASFLKQGSNTISVAVTNTGGLPALWLSLHAGALELDTDPWWRVSLAGATPEPAILASESGHIESGNPIDGGENTWASLRAHGTGFLILAICAVVLLAAGQWLGARSEPGRVTAFRQWLEPRWHIVALCFFSVLWIALWWNNRAGLRWDAGFDGGDHLKYIQYILDHHSLPLANEGWEMYQPPLYYLLGAAVLAPLHLSATDPGAAIALRALGVVLAIIMFTMVCLSLRLLFPDRRRQNFVGLVFAALLPMNLYVFQYITNELMAATMASAAVYCCLRVITSPKVTVVRHLVLGVVLGLMLLSKSTTVLVLPVVAVAVVWNLYRRKMFPRGSWLGPVASVSLACIVVCGWHYGRVMAHFGNPLTGNWDPNTGFAWWMYPGYRTEADYFRFGHSLSWPLYSAFHSFPDGLYSTLWGDGLCGGMVDLRARTPWNYECMAAGYLFALLPMLAVVIGSLVLLREFLRNPTPEVFVIGSLAWLLAAVLIYYSLKIPAYATAKAFYATTAMVPICAFAAVGCEFLAALLKRWRFVLFAAFSVWALTAAASFWIMTDSDAFLVLQARGLRDNKEDAEAVRLLSQALDRDPRNSAALGLMAKELATQNRPADALATARQAVAATPGDGESHRILSGVLAQQGKMDEAIAESQQAARLAPDDLMTREGLAGLLLGLRRNEEAADAFRECLRIEPDNADAHYWVASILTGEGNHAEAAWHLQIAVGARPRWADAHNLLGIQLNALGRAADASLELALAVRFDPRNPMFRTRLAFLLDQQSKTAEAVQQLRAAVANDPNFAAALNNLAWILATDKDASLRNGAEAVRLASHACELTNRKNPGFLLALAAAQAETGNFAEATAVAREAAGIAESGGDKNNAAQAGKLIEVFQARKPYRRN
jgi:tetratricopeptide (TPR) repeat protein